MSQAVTLLLVTHPGIGTALLAQAKRIFAADTEQSLNGQLTDLYVLEVDDDLSAAQLDAQFEQLTANWQEQHNVLLLTDLEGATPASLALRQARRHHWPLITGLNLPMLLKAINYQRIELSELVNEVLDSSQHAVRILQAAPSSRLEQPH